LLLLFTAFLSLLPLATKDSAPNGNALVASAKTLELEDDGYLRIFPLSESEREQLIEHHQLPPYFFPPTGYTPAAATAQSRQGQQLFEQRHCAQCHSVGGRGDNVGPPLDGVGGHRGEQWLIAHLTDPERNVKDFSEAFGDRPNLMPHPQASPAEVKALVSYLLTLPEPTGGFIVKAHRPAGTESVIPELVPHKSAPSSKELQEGRRLFSAEGCAACHAVGGVGGSFGPSLDGVGIRLGRALVAAHVSPHGTKNKMPQQPKLTAQDITLISDFLMTLPPQK
jgi:mono/diheme cytochrome c family protein